MYDITVRVTDKGDPQMNDEVTVKITLNDINDPPVFDPLTYSKTVPESVAAGFLITKVTATDKNEGKNGEITYSIPAEVQDVFEIDDVSHGLK